MTRKCSVEPEVNVVDLAKFQPVRRSARLQISAHVDFVDKAAGKNMIVLAQFQPVRRRSGHVNAPG